MIREAHTSVDTGIQESRQHSLHHSPLEPYYGTPPPLFRKNRQVEQLMAYKGTLGRVISELKDTLSNPSIDQTPVAFHPPRLIRGVIDWSIAQPNDGAEAYLLQATQVALGIYKRDPNALDHLLRLKDNMQLYKPTALQKQVIQEIDEATWDASHPYLSYQTGQTLATATDGNDLLFIVLGNGAIAAGLDVFLRYCDLTGSRNSYLQVVRYSTYKQNDQQPRISASQLEMLQELTSGRRVIIFDEDVVHGGTLQGAKEFFLDMLQVPIHTTCNLDLESKMAYIGGNHYASAAYTGVDILSPVNPAFVSSKRT